MFWTGAAPTVPGMPERASRPIHSRSIVWTTKASQGVPAVTLRFAPSQPPS